MDFHVSLAGRGDLSARIYRQLRDAVLDGRLRAGERLPPTRELARRLAVSRNTVAVAYDRLTADGFLTGRVGAGTYVSGSLPAPKPRRTPSAHGPRPKAIWRSLPTPVAAVAETPDYDFRVGIPDAALFPLETWRRLLARELRAAAGFVHYVDPSGHPGLRAAIARHVGVSRSVRAGADDVLVTQGAQQALDLLCRVLLSPGDRVAVEEPGYRQAKLLFASHGAEVVGVPVDGEGLDVAALPTRTKLVYVTPSHQFPLGTPMSLARRTALLAWAERADAVVVEDDYDSEFRFSDRPLEPLQSLDRGGRVAYVGSFSKTLLPMLRLGFLVAPRVAAGRLAARASAVGLARRRARPRRRWPGSSTKDCSPATSAARRRCTRSATSVSCPLWTACSPGGSGWFRRRRGCTCARSPTPTWSRSPHGPRPRAWRSRRFPICAADSRRRGWCSATARSRWRGSTTGSRRSTGPGAPRSGPPAGGRR